MWLKKCGQFLWCALWIAYHAHKCLLPVWSPCFSFHFFHDWLFPLCDRHLYAPSSWKAFTYEIAFCPHCWASWSMFPSSWKWCSLLSRWCCYVCYTSCFLLSKTMRRCHNECVHKNLDGTLQLHVWQQRKICTASLETSRSATMKSFTKTTTSVRAYGSKNDDRDSKSHLKQDWQRTTWYRLSAYHHHWHHHNNFYGP